MDTILGIDLGTTNSGVCIIRDGKPVMLEDDEHQVVLPSVVGFDGEGNLLVGQAARNQALLAPERTVKSVKRKMGQDLQIPLAGRSYAPQEISAMILRTLKDLAARRLEQPVSKAVITVPAFFNETQREATREAGELAGLEVVRIINEPTAASLIYEPSSDHNERLLVYDLGGGTFDVSIVQIEAGVVEVLASHGDTQLGGDDFDSLLMDHVCEKFAEEHGIDLREIPTARSRLLQAVEEAKKKLSFEPFTPLAVEFIAEKDNLPLNLSMQLSRLDYEGQIEPLLSKTIRCVDAALSDANLTAKDIDKIILVGGSSRTPLVHRMLEADLGQKPHQEFDPDLCVAMGAAVQGGLIAGIDVGPVLVDITPHTLGVRCIGSRYGLESTNVFSSIIARNTPLPARRSEVYYTNYEGQEAVEVDVYQGEDDDVRQNHNVGQFTLDGLDESAPEGSEIIVRFELNLDGILVVTAIERATSLEKTLTIENALTQFRASSREDAKSKLAEFFAEVESYGDQGATPTDASVPDQTQETVKTARELIGKAKMLAPEAASEDAEEMDSLIGQLQEAIGRMSESDIQQISDKLEDVVFYLEDA